MSKTGIDLSSWNKVTDYRKIKTSGIDFAILRDGYARKTDGLFLTHASELKKNNIPIVGIYHFSYALNSTQAAEEAKLAVWNAEQAGLDPEECTIFFDLEYDSVNFAQKHGVVIDKDDCIKFTAAFCDYVRSHGFKAGVYFNEDYRRHMYTDEFLNRYECWYANWTKVPIASLENSGYRYHQYSARGQVPGIKGYVDMNRTVKEPVIPDKKDEDTIVAEVIAGKWSNGESRRKRLKAAGYNPDTIQMKVDAYMESSKKPAKKTVDDIAREVISGKWSNGANRKKLLEEAGYNFFEVQDRVNEILNGK